MKDAYWFRHDSNASRDMKLMKLKALYDFWGIGLFWSVIELLREQDNYAFPSDESGLDMVCRLVSCSDNIRFNNWFNDCLRFGLFISEGGYFYSESLCTRMAKWESKKDNGIKGGRPKKTETITEPESEPKTESKSEQKPLDKIRKDNIEERKKQFINELANFKDRYDADMLNNFYRYWVEPNRRGDKMKWETEKTWDLKLRLIRWENNQENFKRK